MAWTSGRIPWAACMYHIGHVSLSPLVSRIALGGSPDEPSVYKIIGVTDDFNYESLHQSVRPLAIGLFPKSDFGRFVSVRVAGSSYKPTIEFMKSVWEKYAGKEAFDYNFFDRDLAHLYIAEERTSRISSNSSAANFSASW